VDPFTGAHAAGSGADAEHHRPLQGSTGRAVAIPGTTDTKWMPAAKFVGANDAGSSTGFLLEMARVLAARPSKNEVYLVWLDGEEAFERWSESDGTYGSRHLAARWSADGTLAASRRSSM